MKKKRNMNYIVNFFKAIFLTAFAIIALPIIFFAILFGMYDEIDDD